MYINYSAKGISGGGELFHLCTKNFSRNRLNLPWQTLRKHVVYMYCCIIGNKTDSIDEQLA